MALPFAAQAQVGGTVFQDYNGNGTRETVTPTESAASGITVTAYLPNGSSVVTTTDAAGAYTFTAAQIASGTQVRLEFTGFLNGMFDGFNGTQSASTERFITAGTAANAVNLAISSPSNYCQANPPIAVSMSSYGTQASYGIKNDDNVILTMPYSSSGVNQSLQTSVPSANAGSMWGTGFRKQTKELFGAAFMKRHSFFGTGGPGAIYRTTNVTGGGAQATTVFVTLPNAPDPHNTANRRLDQIRTVNGVVLNPFDAVGKMGLGGVDVSDDGKFMYVVNLFDKRLYRIALNGNPAATPTAADIVSFPIPTPSCANGVARPFACQIHPITGNVLVGVTCSGENGGTAANMFAYAYEFSTTNNTFATTPAATLPLSYPRSNISSHTPTNSFVPNGWHPWINNWDNNNNIPAGGLPGNPYHYPQPLLSAFTFDADGSMVMGIMDRFSNQAIFEGSDANGNVFFNQTYSGGDIIRFCNTGTLITPTYTREAAGKCGTNGSGTTAFNIGDANPPEYYGGDYPIKDNCCHAETGMGALAILPGTGELLAGAIDPHGLFGSGFVKLDNLTGMPIASNAGYEIVGNDGSWPPVLYGKGSGLGDIAILCNPSPLEIGNRVWLDADNDGVQDPNEAPIAGVVINLYADVNKDGIADNNTVIGTATTSADGTWYFNNANVADGDPSTAGNQIGLTPGMGYVVQIASSQFNTTGSGPLANLTPTVANTGGTGQADIRDSDAALVGGLSQIAVVAGDAGENNHALDFGFKSTLILPVDYLNIKVYAKSEQVHLDWATVTEVQNAKFEIERVQNTSEAPDFVGFIKGNGNSNQVQNYLFVDARPYAGTSYYRLVQVNLDGKRSPSKWYSVMRGKSVFEMQVYPNPATDKVSLELQGNAGNQVSVSIYNLTGQVMQAQNINLTTDGTSVYELNIQNLPQGVYMVQASSKNQIRVLRLVVKKQL